MASSSCAPSEKQSICGSPYTAVIARRARSVSAMVPLMLEPIFERGKFRLRSGLVTDWRINVDQCCHEAIATNAMLIARKLALPFGCVEGVPTGGLRLAEAKGTCSNGHKIRREDLERRVLDELRDGLVNRELYAKFHEMWVRHTEQLTKNASEHIEAMRAQIEKIEKELKAMLDIVRLGTAPKMIRE